MNVRVTRARIGGPLRADRPVKLRHRRAGPRLSKMWSWRLQQTGDTRSSIPPRPIRAAASRATMQEMDQIFCTQNNIRTARSCPGLTGCNACGSAVVGHRRRAVADRARTGAGRPAEKPSAHRAHDAQPGHRRDRGDRDRGVGRRCQGCGRAAGSVSRHQSDHRQCRQLDRGRSAARDGVVEPIDRRGRRRHPRRDSRRRCAQPAGPVAAAVDQRYGGTGRRTSRGSASICHAFATGRSPSVRSLRPTTSSVPTGSACSARGCVSGCSTPASTQSASKSASAPTSSASSA